jgi:hypothetical protein
VTDPSFKGRLNDIGRLRRTHSGPEADLAKSIADLIWGWEEKDGSLWVLDETAVPYLINKSGLSLPVSRKSQRFCDYLVYNYGLAKSERLTALVVENIEGQISFESKAVETARFSFWDQNEQVLYITMYNGKTLKLDGQAIREVSNGTRVLFLDDDGGSMHYPERTFKPGQLREEMTGNLNLTDSLGATVESQRDLAFLWMLASCFPQYFPNKPLAIFSGDFGSGKTTAAANFQVAVQGVKKIHNVQKTDEEDFYIKLIRSAPICLLDQLDTFYPWLADILCGYATGGSWEKRKFYNQLDSLVIKPQVFVAITTRNPSNFSRVDLADRSVFFSFKRISTEEGFIDDGAITLRLQSLRPMLVSELVFLLNKIVHALKTTEPKRSAYRMSRFANFCLAAGPSAGISLEKVEAALAEAEKARQVISGNANPLITMIELLLARNGYDSIAGTAKELVARHLEPELRVRGMTLPDARKLGAALSSEWSSTNSPLDIEIRSGSGGTHHYTIKLKKEPSGD